METNNLYENVHNLVERGADIHVGDEKALRHASGGGHLDVVEFLVELGVDIHANEEMALRDASFWGQLDVVKYLLEKGADGTRFLDIVTFSDNKKEFIRDLIRNNTVITYATAFD